MPYSAKELRDIQAAIYARLSCLDDDYFSAVGDKVGRELIETEWRGLDMWIEPLHAMIAHAEPWDM